MFFFDGEIKMAKESDYEVRQDVTDIMEKMVEAFPQVFSEFDTNQIFCVHTKDKENEKKPITLKPVRYPFNVLIDRVYFAVVADKTWKEMDPKRRNLSVFHTMCSIPQGAFDTESKNYCKVKKPDYQLYAEEFAVSGGIPDWMNNEDAKDPIGKEDDGIERNPVTVQGIANL